MVYPPRVMQDYLAFYWVLPGADRVLRTYDHDFILIPPDEKAYNLVVRAADWELIYEEKAKSALFARGDSHAASQLPGFPVTGKEPSVQYFP